MGFKELTLKYLKKKQRKSSRESEESEPIQGFFAQEATRKRLGVVRSNEVRLMSFYVPQV